jgi:hypothetical protein
MKFSTEQVRASIVEKGRNSRKPQGTLSLKTFTSWAQAASGQDPGVFGSVSGAPRRGPLLSHRTTEPPRARGRRLGLFGF